MKRRNFLSSFFFGLLGTSASSHAHSLRKAIPVEKQGNGTNNGTEMDRVAELDATALKVPTGETVAALPASAERSGKYLGFGTSGEPLALGGSGPPFTLDSATQITNNKSDIQAIVDKLEFLPSGEGAISRPISARLREAFVTPGDMMAPEGGSADATAQIALAAQAAVDFKRPLLVNGIYRLDSPLALQSNLNIAGSGSLRANHAGDMLTNGAGGILARVNIEGLRLEAATRVARAINGNHWQYCNFRNLRFLSAGGLFNDVFYFSNSAYWNSCKDIEIECGANCFNLGDTNNFIMDNINWCRFDDIGMKTFLKFHDSCSMIQGRSLSVEGIFKNTTLITLHPKAYGIDLEFIRIEGRLGSSANIFMNFNGAKGNFLRIPAAVYGMFGGVLTNEAENFITYLDSSGGGLFRMGGGRAVAPVSANDPDVEGAFNYQKVLGRLRAFVGGARSIFLTPAIDNLEMNGHDVTGVQGLGFIDGVPRPHAKPGNAIIFIDRADGNLKVRFADGTLRTIVTDE